MQLADLDDKILDGIREAMSIKREIEFSWTPWEIKMLEGQLRKQEYKVDLLERERDALKPCRNAVMRRWELNYPA